MRHILPTNLRRPEERAAARQMADSILRADRRRQQRMAINNEDGSTTVRSINNKRQDGPFAALRNHPQYRAPRHGAQRP